MKVFIKPCAGKRQWLCGNMKNQVGKIIEIYKYSNGSGIDKTGWTWTTKTFVVLDTPELIEKFKTYSKE